jgi:hypothetical protein
MNSVGFGALLRVCHLDSGRKLGVRHARVRVPLLDSNAVFQIGEDEVIRVLLLGLPLRWISCLPNTDISLAYALQSREIFWCSDGSRTVEKTGGGVDLE